MTNAVTDTTAFLQQRVRFLERLLCDAERVIEDRDHTIDRLACDLENQRREAIEVSDYERPELVAQILESNLRGWPRARWQALADRIRPPSF